MPPYESAGDDGRRTMDDVDEYIRARRIEVARRAESVRRVDAGRPAEPRRRGRRAAAVRFVDDGFSWSEVPNRPRRPITSPAPDAERHGWAADDDRWEDGYEIEEPVEDAWSAAARARQAPAVDVDETLNAWGDRLEPVRASVRASQPSTAGDDLPRSGTIALDEGPVRRTVVITGRGAERYMSPRRGYESSLRVHERTGFKPDRVAMWAFLLALALLLGAATSSHAATLAVHAAR